MGSLDHTGFKSTSGGIGDHYLKPSSLPSQENLQGIGVLEASWLREREIEVTGMRLTRTFKEMRRVEKLQHEQSRRSQEETKLRRRKKEERHRR